MKLFIALGISLWMIVARLFAEPDSYLFINLNRYPFGMFSVFNYVAAILYEYERHDYAGIEVDFEDNGFYYDTACGLNWWNYYCEPIFLGNKTHLPVRRFNGFEQSIFANFTELKLSRQQVFEIIQKYIHVKDFIQKKIDQFMDTHFTGYSIICVHYRGTDKNTEAPRVPFQSVISCVASTIERNCLDKYKIFVATDEQGFLDQMQLAFPNRVIYYDAQRSDDGQPIHYRKSKNFQLGEEALIDCLLLSRGDLLIRTSSNLSLWSTYFNPLIPVIELNQRSPSFFKDIPWIEKP